ncbi:hypothetical protein ACQP2U_39215 [Nocardia sp. CA-084685]|uniref:hypothetical protein n=1 Tax=Nocardia sp. CA-084685 TaxID=3239970 RepID=UPI003D970E70
MYAPRSASSGFARQGVQTRCRLVLAGVPRETPRESGPFGVQTQHVSAQSGRTIAQHRFDELLLSYHQALRGW